MTLNSFALSESSGTRIQGAAKLASMFRSREQARSKCFHSMGLSCHVQGFDCGGRASDVPADCYQTFFSRFFRFFRFFPSFFSVCSFFPKTSVDRLTWDLGPGGNGDREQKPEDGFPGTHILVPSTKYEVRTLYCIAITCKTTDQNSYKNTHRLLNALASSIYL